MTEKKLPPIVKGDESDIWLKELRVAGWVIFYDKAKRLMYLCKPDKKFYSAAGAEYRYTYDEEGTMVMVPKEIYRVPVKI